VIPAQSPVIDGRESPEVLADLTSDIPGYSAYWRPSPGSSGLAVLQVLSRFSRSVITALDGAPDKAKLAFLDAVGIDLLPPQAARVPLLFQLMPDSPIEPSLAAGTEVAMPAMIALPKTIVPPPQATPYAPPQQLVFATDEEVALTRAELVTVYSTHPNADTYADHAASITTGFVLYDSMQPVLHHLYLGHDSLLALAGSVDVSVDVQLASNWSKAGTTKGGKPKLPIGLKLAWEYLTADGWARFDPVTDHTNGLTSEGEVQLHKRTGAPSKQGPVNGLKSYWVRAVLETPLPAFGSKDQPKLPQLEGVRLRLNLNHGDLPCDVAFTDDLRIDTSKDFFPFGPQPNVSSTFLIACDQAFRHEGARIGMNLDFTIGAIPKPTDDLTLFWEYSTGPGTWMPLGSGDTEFHDSTSQFSDPDAVKPSVSFLRPQDWAKVNLNGEQHFWLRVRITQGGYGGPTTFSVVNDSGNWNVVRSNEPHPPQLTGVTFSYAYQVGPFTPDHCVALNGFAYQDYTDPATWGRPPFGPFAPLPDRFSAIYLGFDKQLPIGLISLYVDIPGSAGTAAAASPYLWEYDSAQGWAELAVLDETAGFARSGVVQLIGPADAISGPGPSGPTWWIRARAREATDPAPSSVGGVFLNAVWATQRRAVRGEVLARSDGTARQAVLAQHAPILQRQLLEVQEWHGTGREWESLFASVPSQLTRYEKDPRGSVTAVWITWEERPYLYSSGPADRHYTIERSGGLVRFGDGAQGMVPPPGAIVMMSYDFGGGVDGNVAQQTISQPHSAIPYFQQVTNPIAAAGGAAGESMDEVRRRGPQRIRNAGRSVAHDDYEWLAKEASPEVAVARCLAATGPNGHGEPGWVTVVVVPQGGAAEPQPSQQLLSLVQAALGREAPAAIANQIIVIGPKYQRVSIVAEIIPRDPSQAAELEERIGRALDDFLQPVNGGLDGAGWTFGQTVHLSDVVQVILGVAGVDSAPSVALVCDTAVFGDSVPIPDDTLASAGKHLLKLRVGVH
jgi:hypothetical protein